MSEQEQDFNSFQEHLERIFKDLETGYLLRQMKLVIYAMRVAYLRLLNQTLY